MKNLTNTQLQAQINGQSIDRMASRPSVELKYYDSKFWMFSPYTGVHVVNEPVMNERVQAHWKGFKQNNQ